jgi:hypothetical protein
VTWVAFTIYGVFGGGRHVQQCPKAIIGSNKAMSPRPSKARSTLVWWCSVLKSKMGRLLSLLAALHGFREISNPNNRFFPNRNWDMFAEPNPTNNWNGMPLRWKRILFFPMDGPSHQRWIRRVRRAPLMRGCHGSPSFFVWSSGGSAIGSAAPPLPREHPRPSHWRKIPP